MSRSIGRSISLLLAVVLVLGGAFAGLPGKASAAAVNTDFSGTLTNSTTFVRPVMPGDVANEQGSPNTGDYFSRTWFYASNQWTSGAVTVTHSNGTGNYTRNYLLASIVPSITGSYTLSSISAAIADSDTTMYLYQGGFDRLSPYQNLVVGNDDIDTDGANYLSSINSVTLTAGTTYFIVVTSFDVGITGNVNFRVSGPGSVSASAIDPGAVTANAANNSVNASPGTVTAGGAVTLTAVGDRQASAGSKNGDERYIPTSWTSTESGMTGTFSLSGGNYTSTYTTGTAGSYTVTATFTKQTWNGSSWVNSSATNTKTASVTATGG
ncbi:hypothetical protein [Cohnella faecalis]|uniref:Uncharacterized protein n=1 Tax=Cohnella faecalis TaxID=2315694 RepID=A0A398CM01_9BACL|nr:hypothetical protein [Cohnella faecalis]RIE00671.1 hypothetical protein D3H35_27300 [Cohnella faecalis]